MMLYYQHVWTRCVCDASSCDVFLLHMLGMILNKPDASSADKPTLIQSQADAAVAFEQAFGQVQTRSDLATVIIASEYLQQVLPGLAVWQRGQDLAPHLSYHNHSGKIVTKSILAGDQSWDALLQVWPEKTIVFCSEKNRYYAGCPDTDGQLVLIITAEVNDATKQSVIGHLSWLLTLSKLQIRGLSQPSSPIPETNPAACQQASTLTWEVDLDGRWREIPQAFCALLGYTAKELVTLGIDRLDHGSSDPATHKNWTLLLVGVIQSFSKIEQYRHHQGHWVWLQSTYLLSDQNLENQPSSVIVSMHEITEHKRLDAMSLSQDAVLKQLAHGCDLDDVLKVLVGHIEDHLQGVWGCFILLNADAQSIDRAIALRLPSEEICRCFESAVVEGEQCVLCWVAENKKRYVASDMLSDEHCQGLKNIAGGLGFRSCVIEPILGQAGRFLGMLCLFDMDQGQVAIEAFKLITNTTYLAAIAIRRRENEERQAFHAKLEQLITRYSNRFLGVKSSQLDEQITESLETIGRFIGADRAFLYRYTNDQKQLECTHEWVIDTYAHTPGFQAKGYCYDQDAFAWELDYLASDRVLYVPDMRDKPQGMCQGCQSRDWEYKTIIVMPLMINHRIRGLVGFGTVGQLGDWGPEIVGLCRVYSEILSSAVGRNIQEKKLYNRTLRLSLALKATNLGIWDADFQAEKYYKNTEWASMLGYTREEIEPIVSAWRRLVHPDDYPAAARAYRLHLEGKADSFEALHRMKTKSGQWRWIQSRGDVVRRDADGVGTRVTGTHQDVHEMILAQQAMAQGRERYKLLSAKLQVLLSELDHRVKNNLGALDALVKTYANKYDDVDEFAYAIRGKIMAMKAVHDITAQSKRQSVDLEGILKQLVAQVTQFCAHRIDIKLNGPYLNVSSRQASAIAMTFQELFTNALKHGSHSRVNGSVQINWEIVERSTETILVAIHWREQGGPEVNPPQNFGVGLELIDGFCKFELTGACDCKFKKEGFECVITCRLDQELKVQTVPRLDTKESVQNLPG